MKGKFSIEVLEDRTTPAPLCCVDCPCCTVPACDMGGVVTSISAA